MELIQKHFSQLTTLELQKLYQLRVAVFVVEQQCPYQEVDAADVSAFHLWLQEGEEILAYLRVLPKGVNFDEVSIGRVIALRRRQGLSGDVRRHQGGIGEAVALRRTEAALCPVLPPVRGGRN